MPRLSERSSKLLARQLFCKELGELSLQEESGDWRGMFVDSRLLLEVGLREEVGRRDVLWAVGEDR